MLTVIADNLPRLMVCNGSRLMPAAFPKEPGDETVRDEGNAAHYMANAVFLNEFSIDEIIDRKAPNGVFMSAEMADHVGEYLSALNCGEAEVDTSWGNDVWRVNGRADHISFDAKKNNLDVDDLKYGYTIVEPEMHWSLIWHAIGYCITRQITPLTITLRIHQPRAFHPDGKLREWVIPYSQLMELYGRLNAELTYPSDELTTSVAQCRRCWSLATCPAARIANMNAIDAAGRAIPDNMSDEELAFELDTAAVANATMKHRYEALQELASHKLKNGAVIPNYANDPQYANTRWKSGMDAELLSMATGINLRNKPGAVTPAEAKRRGVPEHVVKALTERPQTGLKLVRVSAEKRAQRLLKQGTQQS